MLPEQFPTPDVTTPAPPRRGIPGWLWAAGWVGLCVCLCAGAAAAGFFTLRQSPTITNLLITPTPQSLPPAGWTAKLSDPFVSNQNDWEEMNQEFTEGSIVRKVEQYVYHWDVTNKQDELWYDFPAADLQLGDVYVSVDARMSTQTASNAEYGLLFRYANRDNMYALRIAENGYWDVDAKINGEWSTLRRWTSTRDIRQGDTNTLAVLAQGDTFVIYINGQRQGSVSDKSIPRGQAGLMVGADANVHVIVDFDNFEVDAP